MIDLKTLNELVRLMVENDLSEVDLRDQKETVTLKRQGPQGPVVAAAPAYNAHAASAATNAGSAPSAAPSSGGSPAADDGLAAIESPMVGTYYASPDPDSPPYLNVGKQVRKDDVVCIIEAMKVFNEIKSDRSGVVERILVENGQPVEFGQKMFLVRPA